MIPALNAGAAAELRERTLTSLYNHRPQWLVDAHRALDVAVAAAYGWQADITDEAALSNLMELNLSRPAVSSADETTSADADSFEEESIVPN